MISQTKLKSRMRKKENLETQELVTLLRKKGEFWKGVAATLVRPRRQTVKVNLEKLNKSTKEGEIVVVPGKVLASGELNHKLTVGAFSFSEKAMEKMKSSKVLSLDKMAETHKDGKGVKLIA